MKEYRSRLEAATRPYQDPQDVPPPRKPRPVKSLAERYGITTPDAVDPDPTPLAPVSVDSELNAYLGVQIPGKIGPVKFWQGSRTSYPTLFRMAMDYLPIQASSVPSEHVFSSSAETITKRRNRISPALMEALQMAKFFLKKKRLNFVEGLLTSEHDMDQNEEEDTGDLLGRIIDGAQADDIMDNIMVLIAQQEGDPPEELS